jgi:hypothetical protein
LSRKSSRPREESYKEAITIKYINDVHIVTTNQASLWVVLSRMASDMLLELSRFPLSMGLITAYLNRSNCSTFILSTFLITRLNLTMCSSEHLTLSSISRSLEDRKDSYCMRCSILCWFSLFYFDLIIFSSFVLNKPIVTFASENLVFFSGPIILVP